MRPLAILGVALILVGIVGLIVGRFSYTTQEKVLDLGPLQATAQKEHSVAIPDIAGIAAILAGGFLVYVGRRRT
jgi:xanthosine utilization system XapX-like protein